MISVKVSVNWNHIAVGPNCHMSFVGEAAGVCQNCQRCLWSWFSCNVRWRQNQVQPMHWLSGRMLLISFDIISLVNVLLMLNCIDVHVTELFNKIASSCGLPAWLSGRTSVFGQRFFAAWPVTDGWPLMWVGVCCRSTNQANSVFHPHGVDKGVVSCN